MEGVILLENLIVLVMCFLRFPDVPSSDGSPSGEPAFNLPAQIATLAFSLHLFGLFLKFLYYKYYHIWKDLLWTDFKKFKLRDKYKQRRTRLMPVTMSQVESHYYF